MNLEQANEMFLDLRKQVEKIVNINASYGQIKINNCKTSLGRCIKNRVGLYQIELSKYCLQCDKELIRNVLLHEIIHLIPFCFNHSRHFVHYMNLLNDKLNANIVVKNTDKQFGEKIEYKYKLTCKTCGKVFYRHKLPKCHVKSIGHCKLGDLIVETLH